jgi:hypothetical protein
VDAATLTLNAGARKLENWTRMRWFIALIYVTQRSLQYIPAREPTTPSAADLSERKQHGAYPKNL